MERRPFRTLSDDSLRAKIRPTLAADRKTTVELLLLLDEYDQRKLYRDDGAPSLFVYCVEKLRMSEDVAYKRIRAARFGRRFPQLIEALADGRLHLAAVALLSVHLTRSNVDELISAASHRSKREIELLLAQRFPRPDVTTVVRAVPAAGSIPQLAPGPVESARGESSPAPLSNIELAPGPVESPKPATVAPLSPRRFALQVTIDQETHDKLRRAQELIGFASRDVASVLDRSLTLLVAELEKKKFAATQRPRKASTVCKDPRTIPAEVMRAVFARDGGRCTYVSPTGERCSERSRLEYDHVIPLALGGVSDVSNVRMLCRPHNQLEAERAFGRGFMESRRPAVAT